MHSTRYTVLFAGAVCIVCSIFVSGSAVLLKEQQLDNALLDRQSKVLGVAGLATPDEKLSPADIRSRFESGIVPVIVDLQSGDVVEDADPKTFDQKKVQRDPATSRDAPDNPAKVRRIPNQGLVYKIRQGDEITGLIIPIEGKGLWSTLYGFIALEKDMKTIKGITFYQHGETPGLGGEVDNPRWKDLWPGRLAFDDNWEVKIEVIKGQAGSVEDDPYRVDGLAGATITSRGVSSLVRFWLTEDGFGPYLAQVRAQQGIR